MPCTYYTAEEKRRFDQEEINKLTRMLCTAEKLLHRTGKHPTAEEEQEVCDWWVQHRKMDAQREASEKLYKLEQAEEKAARAKAKAKLTPAERKLLRIE